MAFPFVCTGPSETVVVVVGGPPLFVCGNNFMGKSLCFVLHCLILHVWFETFECISFSFQLIYCVVDLGGQLLKFGVDQFPPRCTCGRTHITYICSCIGVHIWFHCE